MIRMTHVTKNFAGKRALDDLSLTVPTGTIYGLMGLNGAGKTTIIRHLAGYLRQDRGEISIDGKAVWDNEEIKTRVALIPDELYFFRGYNLRQMGDFYRKLYPHWDENRFAKTIEDFELDPRANLGKFSKGMRKQAAFCLSLSCMPDYLILDEPVDGLDPIVRHKLWHYIMDDVADRDMTVLISSHNAKEMQDVCNYIGILAAGKMVFEGDLLELMPASLDELFIEKLREAESHRRGRQTAGKSPEKGGLPDGR